MQMLLCKTCVLLIGMFSRPIGCATLVEQAQNWVDKAGQNLYQIVWVVHLLLQVDKQTPHCSMWLHCSQPLCCNKQARNTKGINDQYALPASNY